MRRTSPWRLLRPLLDFDNQEGTPCSSPSNRDVLFHADLTDVILVEPSYDPSLRRG